MSKRSKRLLIVIGIGLVLLLSSIVTMFSTSFIKYEETRDSRCVNFLSDCKYVREKVLITDFQPFNTTNVVVLTFILFAFIISVVLFSIGEKGLSADSRAVITSVGLLIFAAVFVGFYFYGNSRDGQLEVIGGLSYDESICLQSSTTALATGGEPRCEGDAAGKPIGDYWND